MQEVSFTVYVPGEGADDTKSDTGPGKQLGWECLPRMYEALGSVRSTT